MSVWGDAALARPSRAICIGALPRGSTRLSGWPTGGPTRSPSTATSAQVDAVCSNTGHLLWSGIVPAERAGDVAAVLQSPAMSSGWGIRTMASDEVAYNPISYHNGTVWPHDTALCAAGLLRYGFREAADALCMRSVRRGRVARRLSSRGVRRIRPLRDAVRRQLSDCVAAPGLGRGRPDPLSPDRARDPSRPGAGLRAARVCTTVVGRSRPERGSPPADGCWTVRVENGAVGVEEVDMRIADPEPALVQRPARRVRRHRGCRPPPGGGDGREPGST